MFQKVTIIGVGLIGGSIGLAIKKRKLAKEVVGICRRKSSAKKAIDSKAIDSVTLDFNKGLENTELVIIATPVKIIVDTALKVAQNVCSNVILTDAGSSKEEILKQLDNKLPKNIKFVGSHPMAGSQKSGVDAAEANLFENSVCIVTPTKNTDQKALAKVKKFWKSLGCVIKVLTSSEHDKTVCQVSHMPHLLSSIIAYSTDKKCIQYSGTGYKDMTRLAEGDPWLWKDIVFTNTNNISNDIKKYKNNIDKLMKIIQNGDEKAFLEILEKAKTNICHSKAKRCYGTDKYSSN